MVSGNIMAIYTALCTFRVLQTEVNRIPRERSCQSAKECHAIDSLTTDANKDVSVTFEYDPSESDLVIDADRSRITQVISNIVGNAIKFSPRGSIKVASKVLGVKYEISISDTGGGIPEDILPRLFEKFVTKGHGEGNKKGTGLGLYISKAIVSAHHGEITAFNNGTGATFQIRLPISNPSHGEIRDLLEGLRKLQKGRAWSSA